MKHTFECDDCMVINIPLRSLRNAREGELIPEEFHCVFKDVYKVFRIKGKPKSLGAAQVIAGVFIICLGQLFTNPIISYISLSSVLFLVTGMLSYSAGYSPNMCVAKLSFALNIISFIWSILYLSACIHILAVLVRQSQQIVVAVTGLSVVFLVAEMMIALVLIYWLSRAICRQHFNTLPSIMLKQDL